MARTVSPGAPSKHNAHSPSPALLLNVRSTTRLGYLATQFMRLDSVLNSMYASSSTTSTGSARISSSSDCVG